MANKRTQNQPPSQRNVMLVMIAGGIAVVLLLVFALTRSVRREAPASTAAEAPAAAADTPQTSAPATPSDAEHAAVPRIRADELKQKIDRGEVTVIDVRDADAYLASHIPGALHIPLSRVEGEVPYLPKDKPIVTYCT